MRVLVTGGMGRIGARLVARLRALGHEVEVFDLSRGQDVADSDMVRAAVHEKDAVYHLACTNDVGFAAKHPAAMLRANAVGTANVLQACMDAGIGRVVVASSTFVKQALWPEQALRMEFTAGGPPATPPERVAHQRFDLATPVMPYISGKIAQEAVVAMFAGAYGYPVTVARYDVPIGPGMSNVAALFVERVREGREVKLFGGGRARRWYLHLDDLVEANVRLGVGPEPTRGLYEIGGEQGLTIAELLEVVEARLGKKARIVQAPPEAFDYPGVEPAGAAIRKLGWRDRITVGQAVEDLDAWIAAGKPPAAAWTGRFAGLAAQ